MVRVLMTGSRAASPAMLAKVEEVVLWVKRQGYLLLVGDAPGVDAHVRVCAEVLSVPTTVYGAFGRLRGRRRIHEQVVVMPEDYHVRDRLMAQRCDLCVAVWNGRSRGTKDTFEYARRLGKRVLVRAFDAAGGGGEQGPAVRVGTAPPRGGGLVGGGPRGGWARAASDPELWRGKSLSPFSSRSRRDAMSYEQFLSQWQESARHDGCVNPYDPDAMYPEHREDEARERDPLFDVHPDDFGAHPLEPLDRQLFEDCRKVQGKVVGRHEAVVRTPWYLTSQYVSRKLGCPVVQAAQLADSFAILDADPAMVETFLSWVKARGLEASLVYFSQLATAAAEAESVDPDDALHHATESYQDWEHDWAVAERDDDLAALPDLAWTPMGDEWAAVDAWLGRHSDDPDSDQSVGVDVNAAITEGWHLLDELDEEPSWLERQPARYQVLLHQVEAADDLDQLKRLGQKGYAATWFTRAQRQVFWSSWAVRKAAILEQLARRQLRREVARIEAAPDLTQLGQRLYRVQQAQPQRYSPAQWAALWHVYQGRKVRQLVH